MLTGELQHMVTFDMTAPILENNEVISGMVSIIMPTFNRAQYIVESIQSIIDQTYTNWELLVIDDGSIDHTQQLVSGIEDPRVRYLSFGKIGYGIKLRSTGIPYAKGQWLAFTDSDDLWATDKLARQVTAMNAFPASFCLTGGYNFTVRGVPVEFFYKDSGPPLSGRLLVPIFESKVALFPQTLLFSRDCLPVVQEFVETSPGADIEFIIGIAAQYDGIVIKDRLVYRRLHDRNFSTECWEHGYMEGLRMIRKYAGNKALPASVARKAYFKLLINYGEKCIRYRKTREAMRRFLQAWRYHPWSIVPLKKLAKAILAKFGRK
jgi:glycosyltransferase involved in cell wall biosynthesis